MAMGRWGQEMWLSDRDFLNGMRAAVDAKDGWCQTNRLKYQKPVERAFYEAIRERHSERAASRFILKLVRVDSDLCALK